MLIEITLTDTGVTVTADFGGFDSGEVSYASLSSGFTPAALGSDARVFLQMTDNEGLDASVVAFDRVEVTDVFSVPATSAMKLAVLAGLVLVVGALSLRRRSTALA